MSDRRTPVLPYDGKAEEALLGACLLSNTAMETAVRLVTANDFYVPANGHLFTAISSLFSKGHPLDVVSVVDELTRTGMLESVGGPHMIGEAIANCPATTSAKKYANIIIEMATYRRTIEVAGSVIESAYMMEGDPSDIIDAAMAKLASIGVRIDDVPGDLWVLDDFLDQPDTARAPWCIPGLIRVGWRVMVVAQEGIGKTVLFRQIAMAAAQGIHPLNFGKIEPCRTLIVDLENPQDSVMDVCNPIRERTLSATPVGYDSDRAWLWHRPSGINLRQRADRIAFESVLAHVRPDLVCMGPLYKAYEVNARENDELAARETMAVFDDLRARYGFGLLLEHHAPKESGGQKRKMMPYGSSFWLRWPEIGLNLIPQSEDFQTLDLGRWRGDRLDNTWPVRLHRSQTWPWQGEYEHGMVQPHPELPNLGRDSRPGNEDQISPDRRNDSFPPGEEDEAYPEDPLDRPF